MVAILFRFHCVKLQGFASVLQVCTLASDVNSSMIVPPYFTEYPGGPNMTCFHVCQMWLYSNMLCPSRCVMGLSGARSVEIHWCKIRGFHLQNQATRNRIFTLATGAGEFYRITPSFLLGYWRYELDHNTLSHKNISIQTANEISARQFCALLNIVIDKSIHHAPTIWNRPTDVGFYVIKILACRSMCPTLVTYFIGIEL